MNNRQINFANTMLVTAPSSVQQKE